MKKYFIASLCALAPLAQAQVDFAKDIQPILEVHCTKCHGEEQKKGGLRLHTLADALKGGDNGTALVPGKAKDSKLYSVTTLKADDDAVMPPPKAGLLPKAQQEREKSSVVIKPVIIK
mgnify:CR=1 FL=1